MTKGEREKSTADLEKVTDHVEEFDSESLRKSVSAVLSFEQGSKKELKGTTVKIAADDVNFLINELHLDKKEAENWLKQQNGDLLQVVKLLINPSKP
ncbi:hypothetical protein Gasu2_10920 [Galdieria sulphuraria]|uniref:Nascent polypeptide-associated complex subunit alpha-like UBA domain-containing protein n=1 Tax=Galdieria sulphuraria TaxID=130081 RepID=M2XPE6_GALSU|nr:uncharacterized protein Gasu_08160 [Galdieria sulphuraria]EME32072.1 hypothetical protein Gasu_08160 [Galdieria sulphuraria]GJD06690.1 hypothetical protein Gasu2_10920 [Galdieria sulphuraria]|eukprot:XP_005708592.1 hypothetical protein Gasu_08160 [Galdieria sulphuraria]